MAAENADAATSFANQAAALGAQLMGNPALAMKLIDGLTEEEHAELARACRSLLAYIPPPRLF